MTKQVALVIEPNGATRHLVDEVSERLGSSIGPKIATKRASHVESWEDLSVEAQVWLEREHSHWLAGMPAIDHNWFWADLLPVGGPVLGPFDAYKKAIDAEIAWLQANDFPEG